MKIISNPKKIDKALVSLIKKYDSYYIATAWASVGFDAFQELLDNQENIKKMVVGLHFYQTHPDFIQRFMSNKKVKYILNSSGIYHPKFYLFVNNKNDWECLIGSANFTKSALSKNSEVVIHLTSKDEDSKSIYKSLKKTIKEYWATSELMNEDELSNYRNLWKKNQRKINVLKEKFGSSKKAKPLLKSGVYSLTWEEFYNKIQHDEYHSFNGRLRLLKKAREYFEEYNSFEMMSEMQRRKLAGIITKNQNTSDIDWGWFGSMKGAGRFQNRINENNKHISLALAKIPLSGVVTREDFNNFVQEFNLAFPEGGSGIAIASRLLAMKRPDVFVCLDDRNKVELCNDFGISRPSTFDAYWDDIIERIQNSVWWSINKPSDKTEAEAWLGRVAMLDVLFYNEN